MNAAFGIGDGGQVTGYCTTPGGGQDAYLLTPVPEPSTLGLAVAGLLGLLVYAWRRK